MASINVKGFLREPLGEASSGNKIIFTHVSTTGEVIAGFKTPYTVAVGGAYDINIEYGNVNIMTSDLNGRSWQNHGTITINADTVATTLPTLLNSAVPPTDAQILLFQELVKDAEDARDASGVSANESAVSAAASAASAVEAASNSILMTQGEHDALLAQNEEKYAASGFPHYGNHWAEGAINEGLWVASNNAYLAMGRRDGDALDGSSKTMMPVIHIAGVSSTLNNNAGRNIINLPPAPDGTVIYDSTGDARGTGNANLNLLTEIDPKYGDIAGTQNEAVARAFEGLCKNGDFRLGNTDWTIGTGMSISGNKLQLVSSPSQSSALQSDMLNTNITYKYEVYVDSITAGNISLRYHDGSNYVIITQLQEGMNSGSFTVGSSLHGGRSIYIRTDGTTTATIDTCFVSKATEEAVTKRVDMFGIEQIDMVMKDDEVFDMIQSQSATFGDTDVPTVDSIRPDSFFAVYDGQTGITKGKCVKWSTLTDVQKRKVAAYMKERLWINEDGDLTFTTIRQRSFAGAGNGDWTNTDSNGTLPLRFDDISNVTYQGDKDAPVRDGSFWTSSRYGFTGIDGEHSDDLIATGYTIQKGMFYTGKYYDGYNGRCFFYVMGTVSRLNQGAFVKGVNEAGTKRHNTTTTGYTSGANWTSGDAITIATKTQAFTQVNASSDTTTPAAAASSGAIGQNSGRDDGRFYDAVYADGQGGVVDYRLSAYDMSSPEESAKVWEKVKSGSYRGLELLVSTVVDEGAPQYAGTLGFINISHKAYDRLKTTTGFIGEYIHADNDKNGIWTTYKIIRKGLSGDGTPFVEVDGNPTRVFGESYTTVVQYNEGTSVSGDFTMTDVIGDPANLLQTDALKDGWQGSWIPFIPDGSTSRAPMTRKFVDVGSSPRLLTTDNGATWVGKLTASPDTTLNTMFMDSSVGGIQIYDYTAFAKQTVESTNKPVLNGEKGVGDVFATAASLTTAGCLLGESLTGNVQTSGSFYTRQGVFKLTSLDLNQSGSGDIAPSTYAKTKHQPIDIEQSNDSPAVKALPYQIADNGQCSIGVQANELTYDASGTVGNEWGDTVAATDYSNAHGAMVITASGSDTFVDLNSNTNISTAHELAIPYGWTHNHARASTQVDGIDL